MVSFEAITPSPRGAQRSSPNDSRTAANSGALAPLYNALRKGNEACAGNESRNEPRVTTTSQGLIRRLSNWRRCWKQSRRWMHCRSPLLRHRAEGDGDARLELRLQTALPSQPRRQLRNASRPGAHPRSLRRPAPRDGHSRIARAGLQAQARADARRALARRGTLPGDYQEPHEPAALAGAE